MGRHQLAAAQSARRVDWSKTSRLFPHPSCPLALRSTGPSCRPRSTKGSDCARPRRRSGDLEPRRRLHSRSCTTSSSPQADTLCGTRPYGYSRSHFPARREDFRPWKILRFARWESPPSRQTMKDFTQLADLAAERLGGRVLEANDDFFAPKENLIKEPHPVFIEGKYTNRGKWMDGWESRRRRTPGYDWCTVRLGLPGVIRGIIVDTSFFTGNYPERFSLEGCDLGEQHPYKSEKSRLQSDKTKWITIVPETLLKGDSRNLFAVENCARFTHLRLKIYPDGGVARLRVYVEAVPGPGLR